MTEAGWTREKPTAAGWYWNRINGTVGIALIMRRDCQLYAWLRFKDAWLSREGWLDYIHGEWLGPITPDSYQQGRVEVNVDALVDRFLAWPLPASVCSDLCATKQGYPHRSGTNLLSAVEAKAMLEYVLGIAQQAQGGV